jgi:hypothetical protein
MLKTHQISSNFYIIPLKTPQNPLKNTPNPLKNTQNRLKNPKNAIKTPQNTIKIPDKLLINSYDDTCGTSANCTATLTVPKEMAAPVYVK